MRHWQCWYSLRSYQSSFHPLSLLVSVSWTCHCLRHDRMTEKSSIATCCVEVIDVALLKTGRGVLQLQLRFAVQGRTTARCPQG